MDGGDVGVLEVSGELYLLPGAPLEVVLLPQRYGLEDDEQPPRLLGVLARGEQERVIGCILHQRPDDLIVVTV
jgi:hypothetical protein